MGHTSIVYGHIVGAAHYPDDYHKLQRLNREILSTLPETDKFPWIHRNMFHCPDPHNIQGTYRDQVITFGASYKSVETDWSDWLDKFESILKKLYWMSATIHLETELVGNHTYEWLIDVKELDRFLLKDPEPVTSWAFSGGPRKFPDEKLYGRRRED